MSSSALRAAWESAQSEPAKPAAGGGLRAAWEAAQGGHDIHSEYASGNLAKRMTRENTNEQEAVDAEAPSYASQALGGVASLARDIPGAEVLQSGARALVRGQSYSDARNDIRGAEDSAPKGARVANRLIGGTVAAAAMPGRIAGKLITPSAQGAIYGAASGALQSDPNAGVGDRLKDAGINAAVGGVTGKLADAGTNLVRSAITKTVGRQDALRKIAMSGADRTNYGAAESEAAAGGGSSPAVRQALDHPQVKPLADDVRESFQMQGKPTDDASVLMQVHRELSQNERALIDRQAGAATSRPMTTREQGDVHAIKQMLRQASAATSTKPPLTLDVAPEVTEVQPRITPGRDAQSGPPTGRPLSETTTAPDDPTLRQALRDFPRSSLPPKMQGPGGPTFQLRGQPDVVRPGVRIETPGMRVQTAPAEQVPPLMPSFPRAVSEHARMSGENTAFQSGADATRRLQEGAKIAGKNFGKKTPEAFEGFVAKMSPAEAEAALNGVLGMTKEYTGSSFNPAKAFGLGPSLGKASKITPFIQSLEEQMGGAPIPVDVLRALVAAHGHQSP